MYPPEAHMRIIRDMMVYCTNNMPKEGVTATDIVLSITEFLRKASVVGKFVEYYGDGIKYLSTQDKTTISNMSPEYGATVGYFPYSRNTSKYLSLTGRSAEHIKIVETYLKEQGLYYDGKKKQYDQFLEFDLSTVVPTIAGPVFITSSKECS